MSAYLVGSKSLSVIAKSISEYAHDRNDYNAVKNQLEKYHDKVGSRWLDPDNKEFEERLFGLLVSTNMLSLGQRYEDIKDWSESSDKYEYDKFAPVVTIPALISLIRNWQYQSCEGVANETDFYKMIEEISKQLALMYVKKEGGEGYWGIDNYDELKPQDVVAPAGSINISRMM